MKKLTFQNQQKKPKAFIIVVKLRVGRTLQLI